ncbi:MAG: hypothetical protein R3293_14170 [Candidatus Promineifilaceae bacterium]|nr:hypothetical protein [Candidatus Promineifilaceae bacterium]
MLSPTKLTALSNRVYSLLLYLYPAAFRSEYGYHMAQVFRDDVRGTLQESGRLAVLGLWLMAFFDLLKTAVAEHFWEIFHMPIEKLTQWSGPASVIGGLLYGVGIIGLVTADNNGVDATVALALTMLVTLLLMGLGLFGLYKCLPRTRINTLVFSAAMVGLLMAHVGAVVQVLWMTSFNNPWMTVTAIGMGFFFLGFIGMSIVAMVTQALGRWSFTPLLVTVSNGVLGFLVFGNDLDPVSPSGMMLISVYAISWILLGVALWQAYRQPEPPEPGVFV